MNGMAGLVERYLKRKLVFLDCDDFEMANLHFGADWQKVGVRWFETTMPRLVDYVSVHTYFLRDQVISLGVHPDRILYLPHGVDIERFDQVDQVKVEALRSELGLAGKKVITFIGSLSLPSHPVEILLDAFQQVNTAAPQTTLLIVGGGEEYDHLVARVNWLDLKDKVIFRGRIPGADVPLYYRLADVSAEPVVDNSVGRSSLPIKMFESWAAGVPFVTQDVGDRKMVLGEPPAGIVARAGDANSLAAGILRILSNPDLAQRLQQLGYEQAKKYSWTSLSKKMEEAYQKAIKTKYGRNLEH
jgi:glycosyltransferase involved in cell wall biosynthesis